MKKLIIILFLLSSTLLFAQNELTTFESGENDAIDNTLSLDECKRLAIENNAKIKNAELDIKAAELTKKGVFTKYFPQVSIKGGAFKATDPLLDMEIGKGNANVDFGNLAMNNVFTTLYNVYGPYIDASANVKGLDDGIVGGVMAVQPVFVGGRIVNGNKTYCLYLICHVVKNSC